MDTDVSKTKDQKKVYEFPHYIAKSQNGWGVDMEGTEAVDGSSIDHAGIIGLPMINFTIEAAGIKKARVCNKRGKWLDYKNGYDINNPLGDDTGITGIEIVGAGYIVAVHVKGGSWLHTIKTSDVEGEMILGANRLIDAIWIDKI